MRGRRWTHVGLPQILRWYHCLQLVKYFLLVPLSCCIAQTFGLEDRRDTEELHGGPSAACTLLLSTDYSHTLAHSGSSSEHLEALR